MEKIKEKIEKILVWSERYTRTDMLYLAHGGFWITTGRVIAAGSGFLLTLLLANTISKDAFGTYKFVQSLAGIVAAFSLSGMGTSVTQSVSNGNDGAVKTGFRTFMMWGVLMTIISWGISIYYFIQGNSILGWSLIVVGIALPLSQGGGFYSPFLIGKKDFRRETKYGISFTVLPMLVTGVTAIFTEITPFLILAFFGTSAIVAMILFSFVLKKYKPEIAEDSSVTSYGKHLSVMNILGMISGQIDRLLVFHYLGAIQTALYSISLSIPQQLRITTKVLGIMAIPKFSKTSKETLQKTIPRKAFLIFLSMAGLVFAYIIVAPFIFKFLFPEYIEAVKYSQIFSLVLLTAPTVLFKQALTAHKDTKSLYYVQSIVPTIKIALLIFLVPQYGILGALYTLIGTEVAGLAITSFLFFKKN